MVVDIKLQNVEVKSDVRRTADYIGLNYINKFPSMAMGTNKRCVCGWGFAVRLSAWTVLLGPLVSVSWRCIHSVSKTASKLSVKPSVNCQ